jgi:hypothetical protein
MSLMLVLIVAKVAVALSAPPASIRQKREETEGLSV